MKESVQGTLRRMGLVLLAAACLVQVSIPVLGVRIGAADLLIGGAFLVWLLQVVRGRRGGAVRDDMPPPYVTACIAAVAVSGAAASLFARGGRGVLKEEIQAIEVLGLGWIAAGMILGGGKERAILFFRAAALLLGVEAAAVLLRTFTGEDLFAGGVLTRNRNTYALAAAVVSPPAVFLAVRAPRTLEKLVWAGVLCLTWSAVTAAGAVPAVAVGIGVLLPGMRKREVLLWGVIPCLLGLGAACARPDTRGALAASVAFAPGDNRLVKNRDVAYAKKREAYLGRNERWFSAGTAVRYRRWRYAAAHLVSSPRRALVGSGPSTFNEALKPFFLRDGKPNIDTDEVMMFNLGVNEPDTFSAYEVWAVENGLLGLAALACFFAFPLAAGLRKGSGVSRAAAGALAAAAAGNVFFSHMITGTYLLVVCLVRLAVNDGEETFFPGSAG